MSTGGSRRGRSAGRPAGDGPGDADQEELRALTDALMAGIAGLSGQEYVDEYAAARRPAPGDGGPCRGHGLSRNPDETVPTQSASTLIAVPNYLIRVQLPDRPGALGAVASRIGSVGGDVVSIDILQRDNGAVVDELGVGLAGDHLLGLLRDEILEVDGVSIEALRPVDGALPDRHAELLDIATELFVQVTPDALLDRLADRVCRSLVADFAAIVDADTTRVGCGHGERPSDDEVRAMALWAAAPTGARWAPTTWWPGDPSTGVAAAELVRAGVVLVVGRATRSSGPASASGSPSWPSSPTTAGASWPVIRPGRLPGPAPASGRRAHPGRRGPASAPAGSAPGRRTASAVHRAARSSSDPQTPSARPAMVAAPRAVVSTDRGRTTSRPAWSASVLEQQVHDRRPRRRPGAPVGAVPVAAMASSTSRTWKPMASITARARWARPGAPAQPGDRARGRRGPSGGCRVR